MKTASDKVTFVTQFYQRARGGLGRYEESLLLELGKRVQLSIRPAQPLAAPPVLEKMASWIGISLQGFLANYPCRVDSVSGDLIHLCNQNLALSLFARQLPPSVLTVHDIITRVEKTQHPQMYSNLGAVARLMLHLNMMAIRRADRIISVSEYTKGDLAERLKIDPERIDVVHNGVDHELFRPLETPGPERYGLGDRDKTLLYVGSKHPRKNVGLVIQAMAQVAREFPQSVLILAGPPGTHDQEAAIDALIQDKDLAAHVVRIGFLSLEDLISLYNLSCVFVYPSLSEGFGLPPLEAMACGCPVVVSDATSLPEVVGDGGILVDPEDVEGWVHAITAVLKDDALREELRQRGLARAARFSWERAAEETIRVYEKLGAGGRG